MDLRFALPLGLIFVFVMLIQERLGLSPYITRCACEGINTTIAPCPSYSTVQRGQWQEKNQTTASPTATTAGSPETSLKSISKAKSGPKNIRQATASGKVTSPSGPVSEASKAASGPKNIRKTTTPGTEPPLPPLPPGPPAPPKAKKAKKSKASKKAPPVLWLTSCETRDKDIPWFKQATIFQEDSAKGPNPVDVRIINFCEGKKWAGFITKDVNMRKFLANHTMENNDNDNTYVLFADADTLLNVWAVPHASIVLERFHDITSAGGQSVVVGGEPGCWLGRFCLENEMRLVYPEVHARTNCPVFLNSGLFMGRLETVAEMIEALNINPFESREGDAKYLEMLMTLLKDGRRNKASNQLRMAAFYAVHRDKVIIDMQGSLFRNLFFGRVDSTINSTDWSNGNQPSSCGPDGILSCGQFKPAISGKVNKASLEIIMDPVPNCPTEPRPLFLHGNGRSEKTMEALNKTLSAAIDAKGEQELAKVI